MKFPFEHSWEFKKDVLVITLTNAGTESKIELYGMNEKDYEISDDKIASYLDMMFESGLEEASKNPLPALKTFGEVDYEAVEFMQKTLTIADPKTAKSLAVRMWGVKK